MIRSHYFSCFQALCLEQAPKYNTNIHYSVKESTNGKKFRKVCPCVINGTYSKLSSIPLRYTTHIQKIGINNDYGGEEITIVSMKLFNSTKIYFIFEENTSFSQLLLAFYQNLILHKETGEFFIYLLI